MLLDSIVLFCVYTKQSSQLMAQTMYGSLTSIHHNVLTAMNLLQLLVLLNTFISCLLTNMAVRRINIWAQTRRLRRRISLPSINPTVLFSLSTLKAL